jgi:hypothetical protein
MTTMSPECRIVLQRMVDYFGTQPALACPPFVVDALGLLNSNEQTTPSIPSARRGPLKRRVSLASSTRR